MTTEIKKHIDKLGFKCTDKVTGFSGVITTVGFDLYGCVQALVNPGVNENGKPYDLVWFDIARLKITNKKPVMEIPNFDCGDIAKGLKGPSDKPSNGKS